MASAEVPDHRSVNLLKFCELAPGVYEGSQGVDLRDFIELYHSDLKLSHFGVVPPSSRSSGRFTNKNSIMVQAVDKRKWQWTSTKFGRYIYALRGRCSY